MLLHCPFNKTQFLQNMLDDFNIITTSPYLPTNAVFKTNISFWIRVIFLWGNAVCFCRDNIQTKYEVFLEKLHHALWRSAVCISRCLTLLSKELPLLEKSIFLHTICSIIDIEHPFQKCNMFETVSTIKECSFASYHWTTEYCPVWQKIFLWRSSILGKLDYFCLTCVLFPLVRSAQPSFRQLSLKEMLSILSNNNVYIRLIKYLTHIKRMLHKIKQQILQARLYSFKRVLHAYWGSSNVWLS